jgi:hypothetical protein
MKGREKDRLQEKKIIMELPQLMNDFNRIRKRVALFQRTSMALEHSDNLSAGPEEWRRKTRRFMERRTWKFAPRHVRGQQTHCKHHAGPGSLLHTQEAWR